MNATLPEPIADEIESTVCLLDDDSSLCATVDEVLHAQAHVMETPAGVIPSAAIISDVSPANRPRATAERINENTAAAGMIDRFTSHRQMAFRIARRILGSVSDADDMVQELWLRWQRQDSGRIQSAKAWLSSTMTRLCIDQLRSARRQREESYGLRAPEPMMTDLESETRSSDDQQYSLATACAKMLEALRPLERAVFLLHEVLGYDYIAAAAIVGKDVANCRQILHRAKVHLRADSKACPLSESACRLARQISIAADTGELTVLLALLKGAGIPPNLA